MRSFPLQWTSGRRVLCAWLAPAVLASLSSAQFTVPGDFPDPQTAIDSLPAGSTIVIQGGTWTTIRIDKPLNLIGDPAPLFVGEQVSFSLLSPIILEGPGSGAVTLTRITVGGSVDGSGPCCTSPGISGGGFSELYIYDSSISATEYLFPTGTVDGHPGVSTAVPFTWIERCSVMGSPTDGDSSFTSPILPTPPPAGIEFGGELVLLDSIVESGGYGVFAWNVTCASVPCSDLPVGGTGVQGDTLFRSGSTIIGGPGVRLYVNNPSPQLCCTRPIGPSTEVVTEVVLANDLALSGPPQLGTPWTISWTLPGSAILLRLSFGLRSPIYFSGLGFFFLQTPLSRVEQFDMAMPTPGSITIRVPSNPSLIGTQVGLWARNAFGFSRPVSGVVVP